MESFKIITITQNRCSIETCEHVDNVCQKYGQNSSHEAATFYQIPKGSYNKDRQAIWCEIGLTNKLIVMKIENTVIVALNGLCNNCR